MMKRFDFEAALADITPKESYAYPQPEGLVTVQDYLFSAVEGTRCVLIRWCKEADFPIDEYTFELQQLDVADQLLESVTVTYKGRDIPAAAKGDSFVPERAVTVLPRCHSIRVQLVELISGNYVYRVKGIRVEVGYRTAEPWQYDVKGGRKEGLSDRIPLRVESKRRYTARACGFIAFLAALALAVVILFPWLFAMLKPYAVRLIPKPKPEPETTAEAVIDTEEPEQTRYAGGFESPDGEGRE